MLPFADKKYNIIYADPPWENRDKAQAGERGVEFKYPVIKVEDIMALPVHTIAEDQSVCVMWVTMPHLPSDFAAMAAWGSSLGRWRLCR